MTGSGSARHAFRTAGIAKTALIRDDDAVTGVRYRLYLVAPDFTGIRETVQEYDGRAFSVYGHGEIQFIHRQGCGMCCHIKWFYYFLFRRASLATQHENNRAHAELNGVMNAN